MLAHRPAVSWPAQGAVVFDGYSTRYREGLDLVVKGITARIAAREKVRRQAWWHGGDRRTDWDCGADRGGQVQPDAGAVPHG